MNPLEESEPKDPQRTRGVDLVFWTLFGGSACVAACDFFLFILALITHHYEVLAIGALLFMLFRCLLICLSPFVPRAFGMVMLVSYMVLFLLFLASDIGT